MRGLIREAAVIVLLIASTLAAYWPIRSHQFVHYDDEFYISANERVANGLTAENVAWAFSTGSGGNWHPLTWLSHMADVELFGIDPPPAPPTGHHVMGVAIHILNAIVLFLLLRSMTGNVWPSAFVAGLFALHPLRVESVAWAAERKDVLSVLFGLLAIWSYAAWARRPGVSRYLLVVACYALSLLSKAMFVTLPFLLLLLDYWPLRRIGVTVQTADGVEGFRGRGGGERMAQGPAPGWTWPAARRLVLEKLPLFAIAAAITVVTFIAQKESGATQAMGMLGPQPASSTDHNDGGAMQAAELLSTTERLGNALISYVRYLGKTFWPADLAVLYPHPGRWPTAWVMGAAALLIAITIVAVLSARRHPWLIVGWLWFLGTLVPVIGLVQVGVQSMADRYSYMPSIGLLIALVWGALGAFGFERGRVLSIVGLMALAALWVSTRSQLKHWHDTKSLYQHAFEVTRDNYVMSLYLAMIHEKDGSVGDALKYFEETSRIRPDDPILQFKVADLLTRQGRIEEAMGRLRRVVELAPDEAAAMNNLAWHLATNADARLRNGPQAVVLAERACALTNHQSPDYLDTLAAAYAEVGRYDDAVKTARRARELALAAGRSVQSIDRHIESFAASIPIRSGG